MDKAVYNKIISAQKREITEYHIYSKLASFYSGERAKILSEIALQEKGHYEILRSITNKEVPPSKIKIYFYSFLAKILGLNFTLQWMEKMERFSIDFYKSLAEYEKELNILKMVEDETEHERKLISLIDEKFLSYIGSFVLGLNDALVELTGAKAGLTLAYNHTRIKAIARLITGIAASFSMAASNYLASKEEEGKNPIFSGLITGVSYIVTVLILVFPYLILKTAFIALIFTFFSAIFIIALFTFYVSVAKRENFIHRFSNMVIVSLMAALINFSIGFAIKKIFGIEV
jgi:VIT1/CCC1 family predicted Fe2+/Mn2+ transporter